MAAPVWESVGEGVTSNGSSTDVTITAPSGIADDDLLLVSLRLCGVQVNPTLTGFTLLTSVDGVAAARTLILYKQASSESGNYVPSWVGGSRAVGAIQRISNVDWSGGPFVGATPTWATGTSANPDPPATATVASDDYLFYAVASQEARDDGRFTVDPTSYTKRSDRGTTGGGAVVLHGGAGVWTRTLTATSDDPSATTSNIANDWVAQTLIVKGSSAPPAPIPPRHRLIRRDETRTRIMRESGRI